jgi:hypothetical protein
MRLRRLMGLGLLTVILVSSLGYGKEEGSTKSVSSILNNDGT